MDNENLYAAVAASSLLGLILMYVVIRWAVTDALIKVERWKDRKQLK